MKNTAISKNRFAYSFNYKVVKMMNKVQRFKNNAIDVITNQKGNTSSSQMFWILGSAVVFALVIGFIKVFMPEIWDQIKAKALSVI
ncbi:hypothetical protein [Paenibacillus polymyxa]|uniref:hypothetical protein n=1 Tax=Paenibacillus polymyxa TaxID=1406 RepID=UPI00058A03E6|nr:hypothetical protein [Paenibacillus polymyxa]AJE54212.1 hypothetical protein RE92_24785 [Paenibacillus polymyxa]